MTSILTLNKNRTNHLKALISGLNLSTIKPTELVIVEMSDSPVKFTSPCFPIKTIIIDGENLPLAKARNTAAQNASTEKLLFLDVDCIPSSNFVQYMSETLDKYNEIISCEVLYLPKNAINYDSKFTELNLQKLGMKHPHRDFPTKGLKASTNPGLFWSLAFAINKNIFNKIGGFSEEFIGYGGEDTDFGFTANKLEIKNLMTSETKVYHQYHETYDPPYQHLHDIIRNAQKFYQKWGFWCMEGWLEKFAAEGLIKWNIDSDKIILKD